MPSKYAYTQLFDYFYFIASSIYDNEIVIASIIFFKRVYVPVPSFALIIAFSLLRIIEVT